MSQSQPNLVLFYADLGRPYLPLIRNTVESAKRVMPDCKITLLTPTPSAELCGLFDEYVYIKMDTTWKTVCYDKARTIMTWQGQLKEPCIFIDPDLEFRQPVEMPDEDVGLLWRDKSANPVNAGMIFARPGSPIFWKKYGNTVASLPNSLRSWWCDQLGFSVLLGCLHKEGDVVQAYDARVKLLADSDICCQPEKATTQTKCLHFKGIRKGMEWAPYFAPPADQNMAMAV